jgi:hypothetical protein
MYLVMLSSCYCVVKGDSLLLKKPKFWMTGRSAGARRCTEEDVRRKSGGGTCARRCAGVCEELETVVKVQRRRRQ